MRMAAYCRVSTEKDEQLSSLKNQKEFFEQYAAKSGDTLVKIYADEGISGKSMKNREAFLQMLNDSRNGLFDYVAVKDISRFARNTSDFLYGIRTLRANGVDVRFLSGNMTVIGESEFVLTVFAALAQEESSNLSKRVIFGKNQNAKKGRVPNLIYGYERTDLYTLIPHPEESAVVRLIFKWYIEGLGTRCIAAKLNEMGIPTKKNVKWIPQTVRRILQNPIYIGKLTNHKSVTKDFLSGTREMLAPDEWYTHDRPELQIINQNDFALVQKKLAERQKQFENTNPGHRYSSRHLFSNLIQCGECGKGFTAKVYHWKNTYIRYRCSTHNSNKSLCSNSATVDEDYLLEEIKKYLLCAIPDKSAFAAQLLEYIESNSGQATDFSQLSNAKKSLIKRKSKLKELYIEGIIPIEELKQEYDEIDKGMESIEAELSACEQPHLQPEELDIEALIAGHEFCNADMRLLLQKIIVYPDRSIEIFLQ